jgi:hypothetical protein
MSKAEPPTTTSVYPDRMTTLVLVGVFQVLLGCLCGLMALMVVAASALQPVAQRPQGPAMNRQAMIQGVGFYLTLAVALVWLGIGLARARRWAWTLTVVLSWMWLIVGAVAFVMVVFFVAPAMAAFLPKQMQLPPEAMMAMWIFLGVFTACFYILLPGAFVVLLHRESVRVTCLRRDPNVRWTDRCPMPVLALSIMLAVSVVSMSSLILAYGSVMPLFGVLISGTAGSVVIVSIALVLAYLAWGAYRLKPAAWWGMLLLGVAWALNMVISFSRTDLMELYEKMGMPADQLEIIRKTGMVEAMSRWGPWGGLVGGAFWLGYLLYVRRYFLPKREEDTLMS